MVTKTTQKTQQSDYPTGMPRRVRQPIFEKDLLTAGRNIIESMTIGVFRDEQALNDACLYLGWLEMFNDEDGFMEDEINVALYRINGTMAIDGRARDEAVQSHVGIFFPRNASKEDKKRLEKMQFRYHDKDENEDENKGQSH